MSDPCEADKVKIISSLFSPEKNLIEKIIQELEVLFGPIDWISPELFFDRTRFYAQEMGWPLHRRFISFEELIRPDTIVDIKLTTNDIEKKYLQKGRRRINIDPGYISLERLILATGKNYTHRIYLSKGIYGDLSLVFHKRSFRPLPWTYKDYADPGLILYLNDLRSKYKNRLRGMDDQS